MGVFKRGNFYWVRFWFKKNTGEDSTEYKWSSNETIKKKAEDYLSDIKRSIRDGIFEDKYLHTSSDGEKKLLLSEGIVWYTQHHVDVDIPKEKNRRQMRLIFESLQRVCGDKPMIDFRMKDIENYKLKRLQDGLQKLSINRELGTISGLFSMLSKYDIIPLNPIAGKIVYYSGEFKRKRYANKEEFQRIMNSIENPEFKMMVLIATITGMRRGNVVKLELSNINLERRFFLIEQEKGREGKKKTNILPFPEWFAEKLSDYIDKRGITGRLFTWPEHKLSFSWAAKMRELEIENLRLHDLRRTFSTEVYNHSEEADAYLMRDLLAHSKADTTMDVYTIPMIEKKRRVIEAAFSDDYMKSIKI